MPEAILEVHNLGKAFGGLLAVDSVSFQVNQGGCSSIIGPNGAGKTTLFNLISGYLSPDSGKVIFQGNDITGIHIELICRKGIARSFQLISIFPRLTAYEGVLISLLSRERKSWNLLSSAKKFFGEEVMSILESVGLSDRSMVLSGDLSLGDQKRLELGMVVAQDPTLLLLDEPTAGMSPVERVTIMELLQSLSRKKDFTILFTEHDMSLVFSISDWIGVMHMGKLIAEGSPEVIKNNEIVKKVYLGETE
jgi:branched-chain amino acid transport system ATP-binding protein